MTSNVVTGNDYSLLDVGVSVQNRFDFSQLDAEASYLDLIVDPTEILDVTITTIAGEVAGFVQTF